jgi:IS5 family transposase
MGRKQLGFSDYGLTTAKKQTKREKFLSEMELVVPWQALIDLIEPHYPKASKKGGRPPYPLATMRRFAGIELISDRIPDETTILTFRHLLEKDELGEQIFETVKAHLSHRGMTMRQGTIVDATLIAAPSSTKSKDEKRDPEIHQTKKGNQWYYGMKVHIGVDVAMRPGKRRVLPDTPEGRLADLVETAKAHIRSKVEHPFRVIKQQFGFQKTRLRGIAKNHCKIHVLAALTNLFLARRQLLPTA